ncbi:uncharacterized protein PHACADRAFT_249019 [Phanerochaete carnosa HHB-10118-sp]|uniref:Pyrrolo-quinoline quinone repeat domain-containing protein n=1 Tax=Phanerochaete carnosa (strain HHB-10118-sp) TaxID=650164 RepID=K5WHT6_PHACS|nr:uncharacterized protein PHACADRAFT_249019 [Phanerochaete carnosa HHB-10118-sp]EKM58905.1 hypothetical protein PHACADRAFT_249019 [Phanerochaete carnosa HHB-10118-sp]
MEDVICNEQERAVARRTITKSDMAKWPYITTDSAGRLDGGLVFVGPTEAEARPLKLKHFIFADSQDPSSRFKRYALSDDGELLAASFDNGGILIWRLSDGLLVQRLQHQDHTGDVESLSFSPNSQSLVSGSEDKSATVWDPRSGHVLLRLEHTETVTKVAYAPHGALIATASGDRSIKIWDAWTGACVQSFDADEIIYKLAFSPDGLRFYAEAGLGVRVYDVRTYTPIARLQDRMGSDSSWSISCQGDYIVTASYGQVKIWSAVTGEEILAISHPQELSSPAAFSPDGAEVLASCGADKTAVTFDSRTGQLRRIFKLSDRARWAAYSPDGDYVVLGDSGGELKAFDTKSGSFLARLETGGGIFDVQFVPDSKHLLIDFEDKPPILCNIYDVMRMR